MSEETTQQTGDQSTQTTATAFNYEEWSKSQPEDLRNNLNGHIAGLKTSLDSERENVKNLRKQVNDLLPKATKGSELEAELTKITQAAEMAERRADFTEAAVAQGVKDLKLAWIAVSNGDFMKRGQVDFEALKAAHPSLFGSTSATTSNAGSGNGAATQEGFSMTDYIRQRAGR